MRHPARLFTVLLALILVAGFVLAEDKPADKPKAPAQEPAKAPAPPPGKLGVDYHLASPIVKDVKEIEAFIYAQSETTFEKMMESLQKGFFELMNKEGENGTVFDYPAIFIYQGATQDKAKPFTLQTGYPVRPGAKAIGEFKVKKLEGHRCYSAYYTGPLKHIGEAYTSLYGQLFKAGHAPTGQSRELYLFWDGEESPNTVVEIQIGIAAAKKE